MKTLRIIAILVTLYAIGPFQLEAFAGGPGKVTIDRENFSKLSPSDQERTVRIVERFEAIANIDRSELDATERKGLRTELRDLRREAEAINAAAGGTVIYISTGLIIIILLLIILL